MKEFFIENDLIENEEENAPVRISEKYALTIPEAAKFFNIGQHVIRRLTQIPRNNYTLVVGNKHLVKKDKFIEYLNTRETL